MIEINIVNKDYLFDIKEAALNTIGVKAIDIENFTPELFEKYLISEHSPIRTAIFKVLLVDISYYSSVHFVRHKQGIEHFVSTNRPDRKNKERNINDTVNHLFHGNLQSLINISKVRLCKKSEKDTRELFEQIKRAFVNMKDPYMQKIGKVLVPSCVYRFGCPEFKTCNHFDNFLDNCRNFKVDNIKKRYEYYNKFFNK